MTIKNRYDFVMIFDVENGNPNGDPDFENAPRTDMDTGYGIVTDVCLKRKVRNYIEMIKGDEPGYGIIIKPGSALNTKFTEVYQILGLKTGEESKKITNDVIQAREYICKNYFDVRTFGAVMSTGDDRCGTVRGPVQFNFAKSVSPVDVQELTISRMMRTREEKRESGETELGKKSIIPYGLYRAEGYVSAALAEKTGFSEEDLELLWKAIINMFEEDHSAARGKMCMRKLIVFKHEDKYGNAPSHQLFDKVTIVQKDENKLPRAYSDYDINIDTNMPAGVEVVEKI